MPRPNLGTDVIDDLRSVLSHSFCKPQVEARIVDQEEDIGLLEFHDLFKRVLHDFDEGEMLDHFQKSHEPELTDVINKVHPLPLHLVAAYTEHIKLWILFQELTHHTRPVQVPRRFSRYDHDLLNHHHTQRTMIRSVTSAIA